MAHLTGQELSAIKKRCDAADKGPWVVGGMDHANAVLAYLSEPDLSVGYPGLEPIFPPVDKAPTKEETCNLEFSAHARQDIPRVLAHIEALDAELAEVKHILMYHRPPIGGPLVRMVRALAFCRQFLAEDNHPLVMQYLDEIGVETMNLGSSPKEDK